MIIVIVLIKAFWESRHHMWIRLPEFHLAVRSIIKGLRSSPDVEKELGLVWNKERKRYDNLDLLLEVLSKRKIFKLEQQNREVFIHFHEDTGHEVLSYLHEVVLEAEEHQPLRELARQAVNVYEEELGKASRDQE